MSFCAYCLETASLYFTYYHVTALLVTLGLVGKLSLDPVTPFFTWLLWPTIPKATKPKTPKSAKTKDPDADAKAKAKAKAERKENSRWKFWTVFLEIGLQGDWRNFFYENPFMLIRLTTETLIRIAMTMVFSHVTRALSTLASNNEIDIWMPYLYCLIALMVFNMDINNVLQIVFHESKIAYRELVLHRITTDGTIRVYSAPGSVVTRNGPDKMYGGIPSYSFCFEDITDTIGDLIIQIARATVFFIYIMYQEPRTFLPFIVAYNVIIKKLVPLIMYDPEFRTLRDFWKNLYYDVLEDHEKFYNPLTATSLYENKIVSTASLGKMSQEYSDRVAKMARSRYYLSFIKSSIVYGMAIFACQTQGYNLALLIILSGKTVFDAVDAWVNCQQIQTRAERSMDKMTEILDDVDETTGDSSAPIRTLTEFQYPSDLTPSNITRISFTSMVVTLDADAETLGAPNAPTSDSDTSDASSSNESETTLTVYIPTTSIEISKSGITLFDGPSGCAKTTLLMVLAGLIDTYEVEGLEIEFTNGEVRHSFESIVGHRYLFMQFSADNLKYNGKIDTPMNRLFPGAETIDEVRAFLMEVFKLKPNTIPKSLDAKPPATLSGGEIQRYALAHGIWKIMKLTETRRMFLLFDEPFRNVDVETAQHIMHWILDNIGAHIFMVTHIHEIKDLITSSDSLLQTWKFHVDDANPEAVTVEVV